MPGRKIFSVGRKVYMQCKCFVANININKVIRNYNDATYRITDVVFGENGFIDKVYVQLVGTSMVVEYSIVDLVEDRDVSGELSKKDFNFLLEEYYKLINGYDFILLSQSFDEMDVLYFKIKCISEDITFTVKADELLNFDYVLSNMHPNEAFRVGYSIAVLKERKMHLACSMQSNVVQLCANTSIDSRVLRVKL